MFSLWAWQALEFYSETHCGTTLDEVESRYARIEQAKHRAKVYHELIRYRTECQEDYLESFTKMVGISVTTYTTKVKHFSSMSIACQIQNQHLLQFRLFQVFLLSVLLFVFNGHHFIKELSKSQVCN